MNGKKEFKKASFEIFKTTAEQLNIAYSALSVAIGFQDNAYNKWQKINEIPAVAALALECLVRRQGSRLRETTVSILKCPATKLDLIKQVVSSLGGTIMEIKE